MPTTPYTLTTPCKNCPFRSDIQPYLTTARAQNISDDLDDATFYCHKTLDYDRAEEDTLDDEGPDDSRIIGNRARACAGAMILMEKEERPNNPMRVAERLGIYDHTRLDMDAPVYDTAQDWIDAQR